MFDVDSACYNEKINYINDNVFNHIFPIMMVISNLGAELRLKYSIEKIIFKIVITVV